MMTLPLLLVACQGPTLDPGGPVLDIHTHCFVAADCDPAPVSEALGGQLRVAALGLQHYAVSQTLGDDIPAELEGVSQSNQVHLAAAQRSEAVYFFASLDCLSDTPASEPGWTEACLQDADDWIAQGAVGFKDHAGKSWDGSGEDIALWVGGYNRLAGWCDVDPDSPTPNRDCQAQATARLPMDQPEWRAMVQGLVEDRGVPLVTHAVPWREADTQCGRDGMVVSCFEGAADALVDFARWAEAELSEDARRRIVVAHLGFLQDDPRLVEVLDAGLTVDLTQTGLMERGCDLRRLVADYPDQVVLGTDVDITQACVPNHYEAWLWFLMGEPGEAERYMDTCRGTLRPVGAALHLGNVCDVEVPVGAHRKVLYDNAAELMGLE